MNLLSQVVVRKPICPTLISDPLTGQLVSLLLLLLALATLYKLGKFINE